MENVTLRISYDDRIGFIGDVSSILLDYGLNVEALKLMNRMMYVEIGENPSAPWGRILSELRAVPSILSVERADEMPFRSREKRMASILDSMSRRADTSDSFDDIVGESGT